jgi:hypothetical protein
LTNGSGTTTKLSDGLTTPRRAQRKVTNMNKPSNKLNELILRLERIARANKTEFVYEIGLTPLPDGSVLSRFICQQVDGAYEFLEADGSTVDQAVEIATMEVYSTCDDWGYTAVD